MHSLTYVFDSTVQTFCISNSKNLKIFEIRFESINTFIANDVHLEISWNLSLECEQS